jgi:hypothetical protein
LRDICSYSSSDVDRYILFQVLPSCRTHRHYTHKDAMRLFKRYQAIYIGPKQLCLTEDNRTILCILPNVQHVIALTKEESNKLIETGHALQLRANLIELIRNIKFGPALSLKIGHTLAEALARGEMFARVATEEIVNHRPVW